MAKWLATPFVTFTIGESGGFTFTTLGVGSRKIITAVNITQLSKTTIKYELSLDYYPETFSGGAPNQIELQFVRAMSDEKVRKTYLQFGYVSNSPYTSGGERSPRYEGLITNLTSKVDENHITYNITGYGCDVAINYFVTIDDEIGRTFNKDTKIKDYVKEVLLNNGSFSCNGTSFKFNIDIDDSFPNCTLLDLFVFNNYHFDTGTSWIDTAMTASASGATTAAKASLSEEAIELLWNERREALSNFKTLTNYLTNNPMVQFSNSTNTNEDPESKQYSALDAVELINRIVNICTKGTATNYQCYIDPFAENGYDGIIRIINISASKGNSKRIFYYGKWDSGVLSTVPKVVSWSCDYNATAIMFGGKTAKSSAEANELYANLNTDVEIALDTFGVPDYSLTSSQTDGVPSVGEKTAFMQNKQYFSELAALQRVFNYPYEATLTVLGMPDAVQIAKDTIEVYVFVNGAPHHTSGTYLITGYSHQIVSGSNIFDTTFKLLRLKEDYSNYSSLSTKLSEGKTPRQVRAEELSQSSGS